jgi:hypothetical protein
LATHSTGSETVGGIRQTIAQISRKSCEKCKNHTENRRYSDPPAEVSQASSAADLVTVTRSMLEKRKIDREIEETEDWFVQRQRQRAAEEAIERQKVEAERTEGLRQEWEQGWIQYAFNSVPYAARQEVEIEVYAAVRAALLAVPTSQAASITQRLVDAAVHRALRPWTRKQEM